MSGFLWLIFIRIAFTPNVPISITTKESLEKRLIKGVKIRGENISFLIIHVYGNIHYIISNILKNSQIKSVVILARQ